MSNRKAKLIKTQKRDSSKIKDYSKLKKRLAILFAILGAIVYIVVLAWDFNKEPEKEDTVSVAQEPQQKEPEIKPVEGGQLIISVARFASVDPYKNKEKSLDNFFRLVYDSLFELDSNYDLVPELAKSYSVEAEGKKIIVSLNPAAQWHDGTKVLPSDVVFTVQHIKSNPQSPYNHLIRNIANVTAASGFVVFELSDPNALEVYNLTFPIIRAKSIGAKTVLNDGNFGVIGNGMFRIVEYNKGKNIILRKNENYFGAKPYLNEIKAIIYSDSMIRKNMFVAKEVDLIESGYYELNKYDYDVFRTSDYQSRRFDFIAFNGAKEPFSQSFNRRAIAKVLDIKSAIEEAYREELRSSLLPIANGSELNLLKNELYDKESVKKIRFIGNLPQRLKIITDKSDPMKNRMAYMIKANLSVAGIDSDVAVLSAEDLKKAVAEGDFHIGVFSYETPFNKDITQIFKANEKLFPYNFEKVNSLMESVYKQGNKTFQIQNYLLLQEELLNMMPFVGIGFRNEYAIYNEKIHGELTPTSIEFYNGIENLFIAGSK